MSTVVENLSDQIVGDNQVYNTTNVLTDGVFITLNGLALNEDAGDFEIRTPTSFFLNTLLVPDEDELIVFFTRNIYDVSDQINGSRQIFNAVEGDISNLPFLAIYNGQFITTTEISDQSFSVGFIPIPGDELKYIRSLYVVSNDRSFYVTGEVKKNDVLGAVFKNNLTGTVNLNEIQGTIQYNTIKGTVEKQNLVGEIEK
jgi:hypothetical protein